jgi:hypothetical protein
VTAYRTGRGESFACRVMMFTVSTGERVFWQRNRGRRAIGRERTAAGWLDPVRKGTSSRNDTEADVSERWAGTAAAETGENRGAEPAARVLPPRSVNRRSPRFQSALESSLPSGRTGGVECVHQACRQRA